MNLWEVSTKRGESRAGFGLNNNPVSQANRAKKQRRGKVVKSDAKTPNRKGK